MFAKNKGIGLVLLTACISGFSIFLNQFGVKGINPFVFTGLKNTLVALVITTLFLARSEFKNLVGLKAKQWLSLVLVGIIGGGIPFLLFFKGLQLTTAAQASFWHKNMFLLVLPLATLFLKEKVSKNYLIVALLLLFGNILLLKNLVLQTGLGDLLLILASTFWAAENVLAKKLLQTLSVKTVVMSRMFFGALTIWLFLVVTNQASLVLTLSLKQVGWVVITTALLTGYVLTWYGGLKQTKLTTAVCILLLGGPITSILSLLFLQQLPSLQQWTSLAFTVLGILLLLSDKKRAPAFSATKP